MLWRCEALSCVRREIFCVRVGFKGDFTGEMLDVPFWEVSSGQVRNRRCVETFATIHVMDNGVGTWRPA